MSRKRTEDPPRQYGQCRRCRRKAVLRSDGTVPLHEHPVTVLLCQGSRHYPLPGSRWSETELADE